MRLHDELDRAAVAAVAALGAAGCCPVPPSARRRPPSVSASVRRDQEDRSGRAPLPSQGYPAAPAAPEESIGSTDEKRHCDTTVTFAPEALRFSAMVVIEPVVTRAP